MKTTFFAILGLISTGTAQAGPRTSANYTITTDTADAGGRRATSASYTNDGSAGLIVGVSTVASPSETAKHGYVAQLYEVGGFTVSASPATVNEGATRQVIGGFLLDDATLLAINAASVAWSAASPLTINASGLATAGIVYQNTMALVQGTYLGSTGSINLTILNVNTDDFGSYAGDGIGDDWQVQYFGLPPNANAGPNIDFDHTGQTNLFKYTAGLNPLDPNSRFVLKIAPVPNPLLPGQFLAGQKNLIFSPRFADRTYTVFSNSGLATGLFSPLTNPSAPSDNGTERTITDLSATGPLKFYRVEITKP